ncbi:hypothetical protein Q8F55_000746 [Vanrija albida]|uniref:AB hydrolase-1 domain-containing protein n=1 Tax=Vanrija albida TaxID=181172 RepID=A0ABR3QEL9_9TREE
MVTATKSHPASHSPLPLKSFYLPTSSVLARILALPSQLLFAIMGLVGLAHYARQIVRVRPRNPAPLVRATAVAGNGASKELTVDQWVEDNVPSLKGTFTPSWWLPNGHLQTMWIVSADFSKADIVKYTRTMLRVPDGGTIAVDITPENHDELPADAPTVVVLHGLTGNSQESYVRNVLAWVVKPVSEGGLGGRGVVVNSRGCGGDVPITTPQLYSAAASCDIHNVAHYLRNRFPESALHGIGFSLGASILARYLGERGSTALLSSGCLLGCPWDITALSHALEDGWFSSRVYSNALGSNLVRLFFSHYDKDPAMWEREDSPLKHLIPELKRLRGLGRDLRLKMVDDVMTSQLGGPHPPFPFANADEYYRYAGSHQLIHNIQVPTLGINAMDDPVVHGDALPINEVQDGSHVHLAVTGGGGHLGWFDGAWGSTDRWVRTPIAEFLAAAARDLPPGPSVVVGDKDADGWFWVEGEPVPSQTGADPSRVGWKVLAEGITPPDLTDKKRRRSMSQSLAQGL